MRVLAPAKTHLFLEVPRRRDDGHHELDTVIVEIGLCDALTVEPKSDGVISLDVVGAKVPADADNLAWRAAEVLRAAAGRPELGAHIDLDRRIPAGGGLGGGSSDAAAALKGLNAAWELGFDEERLAGIASELGADVPYFLRGGAQRGRGRGELLDPLPSPATIHVVLVFPPFPCPTQDVYEALGPYLPDAPRTPDALLAALAANDLPGIAANVFNRLEQPAFELFPKLEGLRDEIADMDGMLTCFLSGSGSALVGLPATPEAASTLTYELLLEGHKVLTTGTS